MNDCSESFPLPKTSMDIIKLESNIIFKTQLLPSDDSSVNFINLTLKQWSIIAMLAFANLFSTIAFSCIAPFFPGEAQKKNLTTTEIGVIFGVFELMMLIVSPFLGKHLHRFGAKKVFVFGIFFTGITAIAFGFLNLLPAGRTFFWASLGIRCAEALGDASFVTSSFVISARSFPGRIATIVGIMETFAGLGYTAGPVIGGVLYEYGGFQMPFFVLGTIMLIGGVISIFVLEDSHELSEPPIPGFIRGILRIPYIWILLFAVILSSISLYFLDPTLADHVEMFNLSVTQIGLLFLLCGGIYTATAPLWGLIVDKWKCYNLLMIFGALATIVSALLLGPAPFLGLNKNLYLIGISLAIMGIAAGALYIPTFEKCIHTVRQNGYGDCTQTYGCVSGIFQSAWSTGAFIGPTMGAMSVDLIGFAWTSATIAVLNGIFLFILCFYLFKTRKCRKLSITNKYGH